MTSPTVRLAFFNAGIFTEFMEQRAPGHAILDDKIYRRGLLDLIEDIQNHLTSLDYYNDPDAYSKEQELKAMEIAANAVISFANRHADKARELARSETDPKRKEELDKIAEVCEHVPANPPLDFWEALQSYWFVHLGVIIELNVWDSFNPGRLDQHLYPFYQKGLDDKTITRDFAKELLQCFWIKFLSFNYFYKKCVPTILRHVLQAVLRLNRLSNLLRKLYRQYEAF